MAGLGFDRARYNRCCLGIDKLVIIQSESTLAAISIVNGGLLARVVYVIEDNLDLSNWHSSGYYTTENDLLLHMMYVDNTLTMYCYGTKLMLNMLHRLTTRVLQFEVYCKK